MGYYGGAGGRRVWEQRGRPAIEQPGPGPGSRRPAMVRGPLGAHPHRRRRHRPTGPRAVPAAAHEQPTAAPASSRWWSATTPARAALLVQSAVTTWQAYNGWGGASLYAGRRAAAADGGQLRPALRRQRHRRVPRPGVRVDLPRRAARPRRHLLDRHRPAPARRAGAQPPGVVSPGHDEYYTGRRCAPSLEAARDAGVNLAFLGANNIYRRIRLEPSPLGPDRRAGQLPRRRARPARPASTDAGHDQLPRAAGRRPRELAHRQLLRVQPGEGRHGRRATPRRGCSRGQACRRRAGARHGRQRVRPGRPQRADPGEHPGAGPLPGRLQGPDQSYADMTWYSARQRGGRVRRRHPVVDPRSPAGGLRRRVGRPRSAGSARSRR